MGSPAEGRVVAIHLNVGHREPMQPVTSASFVEGVGVEGDRHATEKRTGGASRSCWPKRRLLRP
jgi:hypothetical protein